MVGWHAEHPLMAERKERKVGGVRQQLQLLTQPENSVEKEGGNHVHWEGG